METTLKHKADTTKIKEGDIFSRFSCGKVVGVDFDTITLKNTDGITWSISKSIVENEFAFADHDSDEAQKISRTEAIELIKNHPRVAMTIVFNKKVDAKEAAQKLAEGKGDLTDRQWNKLVREAIAGEERVIKGVHHREFDEHGRLRFTEIAGKQGMSGHRLVDLRTVTSLTFHNQQYLIK